VQECQCDRGWRLSRLELISGVTSIWLKHITVKLQGLNQKWIYTERECSMSPICHPTCKWSVSGTKNITFKTSFFFIFFDSQIFADKIWNLEITGFSKKKKEKGNQSFLLWKYCKVSEMHIATLHNMGMICFFPEWSFPSVSSKFRIRLNNFSARFGSRKWIYKLWKPASRFPYSTLNSMESLKQYRKYNIYWSYSSRIYFIYKYKSSAIFPVLTLAGA
jgi:hypothetical protein